mgnify:CR=1 FL=1
MKNVIFLLLVCFLSGCHKETLSVTNRMLSVERYASYHVGTPDPALDEPLVGQELRIHWKKNDLQNYRIVEIKLSVRYGDLTDEEFFYPIIPSHRVIVLQLLGGGYLLKKGILSYKVEVYGDGQLLDMVHHQLWADVIKLGAE